MNKLLIVLFVLTLSTNLLAKVDVANRLGDYLENKNSSSDIANEIFDQEDEQIIVGLNELEKEVYGKVAILKHENILTDEIIVKLNELEESLNVKISVYNNNIRSDRRISRITGAVVGGAIGFVAMRHMKLDQTRGSGEYSILNNIFNWGARILFVGSGAGLGYAGTAAVQATTEDGLIEEVDLK
ncbi:MAG: hypothetical protein A2381_20445 [Bdellovibrionales bacterium RIFOXYB1_FULL_37_110]|nr:MAG: hypothetical protein A2181_04080 [Bdellovibrionales bacterium RIFOXYA1_FULL_38_20]OFZ51105.1 MAG: hypothetical protein A2417_20230 [Bdellovibrionales bacterium RIFOXYC1_FULL_37_79]OFZ60317.1 MAG: hypothetical protein A2381_20445 [Bdellovibrionales bacterium RIFOXYB1_FULL_37_110]OFZ63312.1 MAG: hypothetical protein A2577_01760 [Bdellovibrionales bacterium RIFOXYD1_FULL_36_51]